VSGTGTVAGLEFRIRLRPVAGGDAEDPADYTGAIMFGGDRERSVLAPLQITGLTSWDLTLGKWVASWATGVVFLLVTLPLAVWCLGEGGLTFGRMLGVYAVMALLIGVICAVSLVLSALVPRTSTSGVLSYLLVFFLTVGTGVLFALLLHVTGEEVSGPGGFTTTEQRRERVWWMLAPNPFVVLADVVPATPTARVELIDGEVVETRAPADLLGAMRAELRTYRPSGNLPVGQRVA